MSSQTRQTVVCVVGTRPEAIKMAPVIRALRASSWARCRVIFTAQHRDLVAPVFEFFGVQPDVDLDVMRPGQSLADLSNRLLASLHDSLRREDPDFVLAQGDTTTVLAAALASYMLSAPFGHIEAGLRTHRLDSPFPEEANRVAVSHLSDLHFAPTTAARENLLHEGIERASIHVTGNTGIDALHLAARRDSPLGATLDPDKRLILVTVHRRENQGEPLRRICESVRAIHERFEDVEILWPVHPNPAIGPVVAEIVGGLPRVRLVEPLSYGSFVTAMKRSALILSDSGGIQEEATALRKPVLVLRQVSERDEAVRCGVARLVGHDPATIVAETSRLLGDAADGRPLAQAESPFGDGRAASRIVSIVKKSLTPVRSKAVRA
ncbi:MAG: UDP-N-acetylglucosamine 2-epimerase (non-hydrolyzing) [Paludisphaera borealis]|uniref:non-hydrolyzing UDP-N-acetylglucosamine 2-epimerase n=1 Tax=Paludisphaera borealis TaxID=1387353 RepID=UPI00284CDD60|nr:UDP-N-acetylglucosamine 2-epimerase (non-hydrolyzing) [Paludisphaera borealis]MDR3622079.1 UDP-N-acetylglucosamine 2-epimerase (non-hydrolyzing) [Paludisphaera borealis]